MAKMLDLPEGQMGNSEVGHMNIGAGRVVYQDLVKINIAMSGNGTFEVQTEVLAAFLHAKENNKQISFYGFCQRWWCPFAHMII
jgi:2,3-bisphosphoglycerate-independent phosphoglycerate mutase